MSKYDLTLRFKRLAAADREVTARSGRGWDVDLGLGATSPFQIWAAEMLGVPESVSVTPCAFQRQLRCFGFWV